MVNASRGPSRSSSTSGEAGGSICVRAASRITRSLAFLCLVLLSTSCSLFPDRDKDLVANSTAAYIWEIHEYDRLCVNIASTAPPNCKERYSLLQSLREDTTVANEAQKIGKLPKSARKRLQDLVNALEQ